MCGIVGFWLDTPARWSRENLVLATDLLAHRGPDASGVWMSLDRTVGLGHRRLSIIDLSAAAHQPMVSAAGTYIIVFNGEIYNFRELRRELAALGHQFRTDSDTEVIIAAYREWGDACPEHLRGMFAFVIYDTEHGVLFMARDRAGEKPLFLYSNGSCFAFASELKALMSLPDFPRELGQTALLHYFAHGYVPGSLCILKGVTKLPPGHAATFSPGRGLSVWPYWKLPVKSHDPVAEGEVEERLERLLLESVREQLTADVPVGILLSGGVDSSLIAAAAARVHSGVISTYTVTFPDNPLHDESVHAGLVAQAIGSRHFELPADSSSFDLLPLLARQFDEPICDSSMIPTYLLSKMVRQHCTVALGGDGGDELFGGYHSYSQLMGVVQVSSMLGASLSGFISSCAARFLPDGMKGRGRLMWLNPEYWANGTVPARLFDPDTLRRLLVLPVEKEQFWVPENYRAALGREGVTPLQKAMRVDFLSYLPEEILVKVDRASMLASLEVRAPFLDHRIIELAFRDVPDFLKCTATQRKIITKRLVSKWLPPSFDLTRKQGFSLPLTSWMNSSWKAGILDIVSEASPTLFNKDALFYLSNNLHNPTQCEKIFSVCIFELWRRHYGISI
jgi:asparagine synthase (glutamine-hydrolysing)